MSAITGVLPPHFLDKIDPRDRRALGLRSDAERRETAVAKDEREIQKQIANYLRLLNIWFAQSRMDRRTSNTVGTPDFLFCYHGRFVAWEVKCPWSRCLRMEQAMARKAILAQRGQWRMITSLQEAQEHLRFLDEICGGKL